MHRSSTPARLALWGALGPFVFACAGTAQVPAAGVPAACAAAATPVGQVQGAGSLSPLVGSSVTVAGVVVGDHEGPAPALGGFYVQDEGDGDPATSDGIFVVSGGGDRVALGDRVRVTGRPAEARGETRLEDASVVACGRGEVAAAELRLPLASPGELERFEGMFVRFPQTLYVTETYGLGRYGEVVLSAGGRLPQPTEVAAPGEAARAVQTANELNRIVLDDASYAQNPDPVPFGRGGMPLAAGNTLRGGDTATGVGGVLTQTTPAGGNGEGSYRLRPAAPGVPTGPFRVGNPRQAVPPAVGGTVRVASFNVLNYFDTFAGCRAGVAGGPTECRGAGDAAEFERQWRKIVAALVGLDADVVAVLELENDGYGAGSALAHLAARLSEAAGVPWAYVNADSAVGGVDVLGDDAIRVALLYRPDRVRPVGRTAALANRAFVYGGDNGPRSRPSLLQAFADGAGGRVLVSVNHLKSKGSGCQTPDAGDGQGNCAGVRTAAVGELLRWLATDPTGTGDPDVLILGDLNAYALEDPLAALRAGGFTDLLAGGAAPTYSYVFQGQWGRLDHALASASLVSQVTGAAVWHINADEPPVLDYNTDFKAPAQQATLYAPGPFRSSDHDPVVVGLRLAPSGG